MTVTIDLPIPGGINPDGTGTGNNFALPVKVVSTGTQTTDSPKVSYYGLQFNPTTAEHWEWNIGLPGDFDSGGTIRGWFTNNSTSTNGVRWKASSVIWVPGTTDADASIFDTVVGTTSTPNATTGIPVEFSLTLTMTNAGTLRPMTIFIGRDPAHAGDTNASAMTLVRAQFEYETA